MRVGFFLKDIGSNQIAFDLITQINKHLKTNKNDEIHIFVENIEPPIKTPSCPVLQAGELWSYTGVVVATSISTAGKLLEAISPKKKMLLIHSPEWFNQQKLVRYETIHKVLLHPKLDVITIDDTYSKLFMSCFNKQPSLIWENFDMKQISEYLKNE